MALPHFAHPVSNFMEEQQRLTGIPLGSHHPAAGNASSRLSVLDGKVCSWSPEGRRQWVPARNICMHSCATYGFMRPTVFTMSTHLIRQWSWLALLECI